MPKEQMNSSTCGDISTLKGSWEASPDPMLKDFKMTNTCCPNQPSCFTKEAKSYHMPYKANHPSIKKCRSFPVWCLNGSFTDKDDLVCKWTDKTNIPIKQLLHPKQLWNDKPY